MKALTLGMVCQIDPAGKKRLVMFPAGRNRYAALIAKMGEGEEVQATISQQRDTKRNSKLHAVLSEVADALGWDTDEYKEFIVTKLRPLDEDPLTGWVRRQKTHEMSNEEIDALITEIKAWACHHMPGFTFAYDAQYMGVSRDA